MSSQDKVQTITKLHWVYIANLKLCATHLHILILSILLILIWTNFYFRFIHLNIFFQIFGISVLNGITHYLCPCCNAHKMLAGNNYNFINEQFIAIFASCLQANLFQGIAELDIEILYYGFETRIEYSSALHGILPPRFGKGFGCGWNCKQHSWKSEIFRENPTVQKSHSFYFRALNWER